MDRRSLSERPGTVEPARIANLHSPSTAPAIATFAKLADPPQIAAPANNSGDFDHTPSAPTCGPGGYTSLS
jgi:hypothetical protein